MGFGYSLDGTCARLGFSNHSKGGVWRFSDLGHDAGQLALQVHCIVRSHDSSMTLKATCMRPGSKNKDDRCVCWVTKAVSGDARLELLNRYMEWGAWGRNCAVKDEHKKLSDDIKRSYGMKIK